MPTLTAILPINVDSTMISCFRSCPEKFNKEYCLGVRPAGLSIDLHAGGCFASAVEETYRQLFEFNKPLKQALEVAYARYMIEWGDFEIPSFKRTAKTRDRMWDAVLSYFAEYPPLSDEVQPFIAADGKPTLEYTFAIPLEPTIPTGGYYPDRYATYDAYHYKDGFPLHPSGSPFMYSGRFDMLGMKRDGTVIPKDDKTTGRSPGLEWARQWQLRSQFIGYVWAVQQCGMPCNEMDIRGVAVLMESIKHARQIQLYSDFIIAQWHEQLRRDLWRMRRMWDEQRFDFNMAESCTAYGNCVFMDACTSPNPETWLANMEVRRWNPLNKNPTAVEDPSKARAIS